MTPERQCTSTDIPEFSAQTRSSSVAELLGRKRGIFVLAAYVIAEEDSAMNTLAPSQPSQEITKSRRIGVLIYPDCDILDLCGPFDVFHYADYCLARFGRTNEPGYKCDILAAIPGPVRTKCGIELLATHSYCDIRDGLDTLVVAGGVDAEQACKDDPALVEWVRSTAPRVRRVASIVPARSYWRPRASSIIGE